MILEGDLSTDQILEKVGGYQAFLPDTATIEHDGKQVLLRDMPDIKNAKDLATLAKTVVESQREIGRRIRIPTADAKPEDVQAFKTKLIEAGVLTAPLASPQDYGIVKPADQPEGLPWNDELATELATTLHKHGAPKALAADLLAIHQKAIMGAQAGLNTSLEAGMTALKAEHGDKFDERMEFAKRLTPTIFKTEEELAFIEQTGLANHPAFLSVIMRLAPLAAQDSSFIAGLPAQGSGTATAESAKAELGKIMSDKTHEMNAGYWRQDKAVMAHVQELYKQAYGSGQVQVT